MIFLNKKSVAQRLKILFSHALEKKIFPGATVGISLWNKEHYDTYIAQYGVSQLFPTVENLTFNTYYDLASLTKPMATIPALWVLMEEKKIHWESIIESVFGQKFKEKNIKIKQLMSHCSGLPAHKNYFLQLLYLQEKERRQAVLQWIKEEKLLYPPGHYCIYSDLGFMLLGWIVEEISGVNLAEFVHEKIYKPLHLHDKLFFASKNIKKMGRYAATEKCPWTGKMLSGQVHDDNCRALGGIAGHAGLFGTIEGVLRWCECLLSHIKERGTHPFYGNENIRKSITKEGVFSWTPGFDTPSFTNSSSGHFFSPTSFGHLGFTGTSFWIDPQKELIIVLLTNRVHPSRDNQLIKKFRPLFHDTVVQCLFSDFKQ